MSKYLSVCMSVVVLAAGVLVTGAVAVEPTAEAQMKTFSYPDGENFFALSLKPGEIAPARPHDVVFLFDTSASQAGDFRSDGLDVLKGALAKLSPKDRVRLLAVDLHAVSLTNGFVSPSSPAVSNALKKLERRVPLGSTDMKKAIAAAADCFADKTADPKYGRAIVYIGDGMSAANLLGTEKFQTLVKRLTDERIPVSCCPLGPRLDRQLLGALAGKTGGRIVEMSHEAGKQLAAAADGSVLWPSGKINWPAGIKVYPLTMPPLRADRDTVVIGTYSKTDPFRIEMTAGGPSGRRKLSWNVKPAKSNEDNNHLGELVHRARVDDGASLPVIGSESLEQARQAINVGVRNASHLARLALGRGHLDDAERLAAEALRQDPGNPEALAVNGAVASRRKENGTPAPERRGDVDLRRAPGARPDDGELAKIFGQNKKVFAQAMQTTVQNTVNQARAQMGKDPEGAKQNLKLLLETVRLSPELENERRDQLVDVIQAALQAASRRQFELEGRRQQRQEALAAGKERMLVNENLLRKQQKVRQLMERFNSLMDEGRYRLAEEATAAEAAAEAPESPVPVVATLHARMSGYHHDAMLTRVARQKGVIDTLYEAEKSHIPTPDEPPVVYPESGVWQELSARRKEKYSSMDLASRSSAEKKIVGALKSPTQFEFIEMPLRDALEFVGDFHDIEVEVDRKAFGEVGVDVDVPVTIDVRGISLRSGLRLMLRQLDLTYSIQDEVLLITTPEEVENQLTTRVFPIADLVIPIPDPDFLGGFGGLGDFGNSSGSGGGGGGIFGNGDMQNNGNGNMFPGMFNVRSPLQPPRL